MFELIVQGVKCDGKNIQVNLDNDKSRKYKLSFSDDVEKSTFTIT